MPFTKATCSLKTVCLGLNIHTKDVHLLQAQGQQWASLFLFHTAPQSVVSMSLNLNELLKKVVLLANM